MMKPTDSNVFLLTYSTALLVSYRNFPSWQKIVKWFWSTCTSFHKVKTTSSEITLSKNHFGVDKHGKQHQFPWLASESTQNHRNTQLKKELVAQTVSLWRHRVSQQYTIYTTIYCTNILLPFFVLFQVILIHLSYVICSYFQSLIPSFWDKGMIASLQGALFFFF